MAIWYVLALCYLGIEKCVDKLKYGIREKRMERERRVLERAEDTEARMGQV